MTDTLIELPQQVDPISSPPEPIAQTPIRSKDARKELKELDHKGEFIKLAGRVADSIYRDKPFESGKVDTENMCVAQKDFIRFVLAAAEDPQFPQAHREWMTKLFFGLENTIQNLRNDPRVKNHQTADDVINWWDGIKAEMVVAHQLREAGYTVEIPAGRNQILDMDFYGGIDFTAQLDNQVFAIDVKSREAVKDISKLSIERDDLTVERHESTFKKVKKQYPQAICKKIILKIHPDITHTLHTKLPPTATHANPLTSYFNSCTLGTGTLENRL